jgi:hypothetical protein
MSQDAKMQAHQERLEQLFSKNQLIPRIKEEFTETDEFTKFFKEVGIPEEFGLTVLIQMALHKRANINTLVGLLRHHVGSGQAVIDLLQRMLNMELLYWDNVTQMFVVRFTISNDVQEQLDRFQFPLPMVIEPREVKDNRDTGYVINRGSIILKNNHHEDDVCLDHINRVNKIPFKIDQVVTLMVKNKWRNLDKPKEGESSEEFKKRLRAFEKYDRTAKDVIGLLNHEGNQFYLTHKYDKRGRIYCQGYHVTYQGAPWNKAVIAFANEELIE